ncbi:flagellin [Rhizobium sp. ZX09]|uniref:flagellin N-terminal helical domain-containing protein n=1 Tax=Rhizobium sp. ZX09 TaxID=2291939 RepID=UPI001A992B2A|nr:flagellin [Rhizobium sp. ZX09]QSZ57546.1 flagellin [Rhizobium sp. ZX09]
MTSILTNIAAMAALQTLRTIGASMADTQRQVSSGLRVQRASDNAAYWSIATTMRSDNMATAAVHDALGLGAAKVDTAYAGTEAIVEILEKFKARLVAATEEGVDRSKIQEELAQLNAQAENVVSSSSFSGVNWLKTDEPAHLSEAAALTSSVVSSFVRSDSGSVAVKKMNVDLKTTSMLNAGGGGILQKDVSGVGDIGGFADASMNAYAHNGHEIHDFTGPATFGATDYIEFSVVVDAFGADAGATFSNLRIDKTIVDAALSTTDGTINDAFDMGKVLQWVFTANSVPAWSIVPPAFTGFGVGATRFELGSAETSAHIGSSIDVIGVTSDFGGVHPAGFGLGLEDAPPPGLNHDNMIPKGVVTFTEPFDLRGTAEILFDVQVNGGAVQTVRIDKASVDAALGTTDGHVGDRDDFATVLAYVTAGTGVTAISNDWEYPGVIVFTADPAMYPEAGNKAVQFNVSNVRTNIPWTLDFDLAEVDVTTDTFTIDEYIDGVEYMLGRAISSASTMGAIKTRIDIQTNFADTLMDSIEKGIGRLVDADMNEASTRLKALQTQEQLATQSLSIANTSAEGILQLFR